MKIGETGVDRVAAGMHDDVIVIGGGIAGLCAALALTREGASVTLLERDGRLFNRASLRNEGKIHLGLIYAAEAGAATAFLQLEGALNFQRLLASWTGGRSRTLSLSMPFDYLVERRSILPPDALSGHYAAVEEACRSRLAEDAGLDYLGRRPDRLWWPMAADELARWYDPDRFVAGFRTEELAIDPEELAGIMVATAMAAERLTIRCNHEVRGVERTSCGFRLDGSGPDGPWTAEAAQVVNAAWDDLYRLDVEAGQQPYPGWLFRLKYRVLARLPAAMRTAPSATLVTGPFGDVVVRGDGTAYLSWYPAGLQGWTHGIACPPEWDLPCRGADGSDTAHQIGGEILRSIDAWMPGIAEGTPYQVDAGAILAHGQTDVDDPDSGLHGRTDSGIVSRDGWHSFNPGKLTTAPLLAERAAQAVMGRA